MVIDSHAHILPAQESLAEWDFADREEQARFVQRLHFTMQTKGARRVEDDTPAEDAWRGLWDARRPGQWEGRRDVSLRLDQGRWVWEQDGVSYCTACREPAPPEKLIGLMDAAGVDQAVIQVPQHINRWLSHAMREHPGRLLPLASIEESQACQAETVADLQFKIAELGLRGLYFDPLPGWDGFDNLHAPKYDPFWRKVGSLNVPVYFGGNFKAWHFPEMLMRIEAWINKFPEITRVLVHGFPPALFLPAEQPARVPENVRRIVRSERFHAEFLPEANSFFRHPRIVEIIRALVDEFGPAKFLWGSEFIKGSLPHTAEHYAELRNWLGTHCPFLGREDLALILGGNARRVFGGERRNAAGGAGR